jgi:hypothetical protein
MCPFEAIVDANHRAAAGDTNAGLHPADFAEGWHFGFGRCKVWTTIL